MIVGAVVHQPPGFHPGKGTEHPVVQKGKSVSLSDSPPVSPSMDDDHSDDDPPRGMPPKDR